MKATLEFDLDSPEDQEAHQDAIQGKLWKLAIWEFDNWMRGQLKHSEVPASLEVARKQLHNILMENELSL